MAVAVDHPVSVWMSAENKIKCVFAQNQEVESVFSLFPVWKSVKKITTKNCTISRRILFVICLEVYRK